MASGRAISIFKQKGGQGNKERKTRRGEGQDRQEQYEAMKHRACAGKP